MDKIKLNPPETAPRDGSRFVAVYEVGVITVSWLRSEQKFMPFTGLDHVSSWPMLGWIEKERFEM
jgi:hypothetical protein